MFRSFDYLEIFLAFTCIKKLYSAETNEPQYQVNLRNDHLGLEIRHTVLNPFDESKPKMLDKNKFPFKDNNAFLHQNSGNMMLQTDSKLEQETNENVTFIKMNLIENFQSTYKEASFDDQKSVKNLFLTNYIQRRNNLLSLIYEEEKELKKSDLNNPFDLLFKYKKKLRNFENHEFWRSPYEIITIMLNCGIELNNTLNILKQLFMTIYGLNKEESMVRSIIICTFDDFEYKSIVDQVLKSVFENKKLEIGIIESKFKSQEFDLNEEQIKKIVESIITKCFNEINSDYIINDAYIKNILTDKSKEPLTKDVRGCPIFYEIVEELTENMLFFAIVKRSKFGESTLQRKTVRKTTDFDKNKAYLSKKTADIDCVSSAKTKNQKKLNHDEIERFFNDIINLDNCDINDVCKAIFLGLKFTKFDELYDKAMIANKIKEKKGSEETWNDIEIILPANFIKINNEDKIFAYLSESIIKNIIDITTEMILKKINNFWHIKKEGIRLVVKGEIIGSIWKRDKFKNILSHCYDKNNSFNWQQLRIELYRKIIEEIFHLTRERSTGAAINI